VRIPIAPRSGRGRRPPRRALSRRERWHRTVAARVVSALLAGTALWLVASALVPKAPDPGVPVLVATHDLALGHRVGGGDLRLERRPEAYVPSGALRAVEPAVDQVLGGPVLAGEIVTTARFRGSGSLAALPPGTLAVSVPVGDPGLVATLRPADLVSVLVAGTGETVATAAPVLSSDPPAGGALGGSAATGARVLLAMTPTEAKALAAALGAPTAAGFVVALHR
jgi:Flp pilus assembly protein CpaB